MANYSADEYFLDIGQTEKIIQNISLVSQDASDKGYAGKSPDEDIMERAY